MKMHSGHIEVAVAILLNYRVYTIVPNVSYGLGLKHECDMLALDENGRFTEIEIKISASDLKADFSKPHGHKHKYISRLVYAIPESLYEKHGSIIPMTCGVIIVRDEREKFKSDYPIYQAYWKRIVKHDKKELPPDSVIKKFMSLGCMRIWSLKAHNNRNKKWQSSERSAVVSSSN